MGKLNISGHLNGHEYPVFLMKFPSFIHLIYHWNGMLLQRNKAVKRELNMAFQTMKNGQVLDAGCGEGMFILPYAKTYSGLHFTGIDKNQGHIDFCEKYKSVHHLTNVTLSRQPLESVSLNKTFDLIYCVGTLQYVEQDVSVLSMFHRQLNKNGQLIIYSPINGKMITSVYKYFSQQKNNYEIQQKRKRVYSEKELIEKLKKVGFKVILKKYNYGNLGIICHEIYSIFLIKIGDSKYFFWIYYFLLIIISPIILLLSNIDFLIKKNNGNGILIILNK
ncbi:MAG: class I SAM-dependent methyltransferase [Bacteroidota bacterium]